MIGVSSCLLGVNCTYSGKNNLIAQLVELDKQGVIVHVCPEVLGGLPIPRDPAEIISRSPLSIQTIHHNDVTFEYQEGAKKALKIFQDKNIKVALLKFRSPSCGNDGVYDGTFTHQLVEGKGVFAQLLEENGICVFNENQINEFLNYIREDEEYGAYFKDSTSI